MDGLIEKWHALLEQRPQGSKEFSQAYYWIMAVQAEETAIWHVVKQKCSRFQAFLRNNKETNVAKAKWI